MAGTLTPASPQRAVALIAAAALLAGCIWVTAEAGGRLAALFLVGAGLGFALYHAAFGFTGAWRKAWTSGRSGAVRALPGSWLGIRLRPLFGLDSVGKA